MYTDVLIIGAGMVGSTMALALQSSSLKVLLLDSSPLIVKPFNQNATFESRVSALSATSQRILEQLGVWDGIVSRRVSSYSKIEVWDGSGTGYVDFSVASVHAEVLGYIVENRVIQDAVLDRLHDCDLNLLANAHLEEMSRSGNDWLLTLADGCTLRASLVIAADGANSTVRRLTGAATRAWDYLHNAIVTSVRTSQSHQHTVWQRFTDTGPLAFLPLVHNKQENWCSIVWSTTPVETERLMLLNDDSFCYELERAFEGRLGAVLSTEERVCVPLRQSHAKRYVCEGLALIGDAAHVIHPLAGQGVNLSFLDVVVLAEVLLMATKRGEYLADAKVLSRYERRRMLHNITLMLAMEGFERLFQADQLSLRWLRNVGLKLINQMPESKAIFMRKALGLTGDLPSLVSL